VTRRASAGYVRFPNGNGFAQRQSPYPGLAQGDADLLEGLRLGTSAAIEALFDRYHGKVYSLAMSILKNKSDAEEATQDVILTVVRKADLFRGNSALYSWIYRICVNTCLMRLRRGRRAETVPIEGFLPVFTKEGAHARQVEDWSREVERRILEKELGQVIRRYSATLPEKYRVVFALCDVQGLSYEETADVLDLSIAAVKSRLHRARLYLRERLSRYLRDGNVF
jgi:RNA polymerase sigma-70 factor (ECF subfamily)